MLSAASSGAVTLDRLIAFASSFAPGRCGVITTGWIERDGQRMTEVYDWCDCWVSGPHPVLAWIVARRGFGPPGENPAEPGAAAFGQG
ncbi:MAG: hypothetical protein JWO38_6611 [Gemmataceae bacterium]|nr:hypothetical protein [Gemmataceae bacterium]